MSRNTNVLSSRHRRKKVLKAARGFRGNRSQLYRNAHESLDRARRYAFVGRKIKKRDYRSLWILRINAAARANGMTYSHLMNGLKKAGVELDRKQLAELAIHQPEVFTRMVDTARAQLN
jgi:large subunit ribosomal protein L20